MPKINLNISVLDPSTFESTLAEAKKLGLIVKQSFGDLGVASGSIERSSLPHLRRIEGLQVEEDRAVSIPTPPRRAGGD